MADIQLDSVTNSAGTGVFDKLMEAVNTQIESQYLNNRITGSDYANVYLGSMQAVLQQSMQYVMQELLTEAQVDGIIADTALKTKQLEIAEEEIKLKKAEADAAYVKMLASIDKEMGYDYTLDANNDVVRSSLTDSGDGVIDYEREFKQVQAENMYTDRVLKDKQAAKLGLDNVMKQAEASRASDPAYVYTPSYEKGV
jgi:hypothetical protein